MAGRYAISCMLYLMRYIHKASLIFIKPAVCWCIRIKSNDDEYKVKLVYSSTPGAQKRWYNISIVLRGNACPNSEDIVILEPEYMFCFLIQSMEKKDCHFYSPTVSGNQHNSTHTENRKSFFRVRKN